eukprot:4980139-Prymnesium_polylepis.1
MGRADGPRARRRPRRHCWCVSGRALDPRLASRAARGARALQGARRRVGRAAHGARAPPTTQLNTVHPLRLGDARAPMHAKGPRVAFFSGSHTRLT